MGNKGNRRLQRKRRRRRKKLLPEKQAVQCELIDGNMSYYPVAYCHAHGGWLSRGLMDTHRCEQRKCKRLEVIMVD